jgi:GST-like protein
VNRLYGVMDRRLADHAYLAGDYSIADMACVGWVRGHERVGQPLDDFPNLKRWFETVMARPAVAKGIALTADGPAYNLAEDKDAQAVLFGQKAR